MVNAQLSTESFLDPIQLQLQQVEARMLAVADSYHANLGVALKHLLSSGGKRIRPAVVLLAGGMFGGDPERLVALAASIELLHTATLVHDDLIDGAFLRRGIATLNVRWSPAATVLTGDFIFAQAAKLVAEIDSLAIMHIFAETLATIVNGEITQLFSNSALISRAEYYQRIYAKTASLFETAARSAAMLCTKDEAVIEKARAFGNAIGMAFQIVDDVLDFTGDQARVGKPVASDLRQGLVTLPTLYYLEAYPSDPDLDSIFAGNRATDGAMERLVGSIKKSGAVHQALDEAKRFVDEGLENLAGLPVNTASDALRSLAHYIVDRQL